MKLRHIMSALTDVAARLLRVVAEAPNIEPSDGDRPLSEGSRLLGDYNFRTGKLDCGTDPSGWYEEDL